MSEPERRQEMTQQEQKSDIVPELYEKIQRSYKRLVALDPWIRAFNKRKEKGAIVQDEVLEYANRLGLCAEKALGAFLVDKNLPDGRIYYNIAKRTIEPLMRLIYEDVTSSEEIALKTMYKKQRIGIKPVRVPFNEEYMDGIIWELVRASQYGKGQSGRTEQNDNSGK